MGHKLILLILAAAAALSTGCQKRSALAPAADCDEFAAGGYAARTDLALPGRYPWCEALDGYYHAHGLWHYGDAQWRSVYYAADPSGNAQYADRSWQTEGPRAYEDTVEMYYLANPERWRDAAEESAAAPQPSD